jgi:hypothetical protein
VDDPDSIVNLIGKVKPFNGSSLFSTRLKKWLQRGILGHVVQPMVSKRIKWFVLFGGMITIASFLSQSNETEAIRVQRETEYASYVCDLVNRKQVWHSPRAALALVFRKRKNSFEEQYWDGVRRLKKIGVLQERSFQFLDTNGAPIKIPLNKLFRTNDVLWFVEHQSNGVYIVNARPKAMKPWEDLRRQYATNALHH